MNDQAQERIVRAWHALPAECRRVPASANEIAAIERDFGPIPTDYRWFLEACGGGTVGSKWLDDVRELRRSHEKFQQEAIPGGWTMTNVFLLGWDGSGNPLVIDLTTGRVLVEDHTFGGVYTVADSFEAFLMSGLVE